MTRVPLGIGTTCYMSVRRMSDPLDLLKHAEEIGAAGVQAAIAPSAAAEVRAVAERSGLYLESMVALPAPQKTEAFEAALKAAKDAGAVCARTACLSGRRYENFRTADEWNAFVQRSKAALRTAIPIAERLKMPLAVENHKDWTSAEFVALLKQYSSPYFGVCLDLGNNISLIEDPDVVVDTLAPYAISTHIKDMALADDPQGFLMAEVPLGQGVLDLPRMIAKIKQARPQTRLTLEMITRDPLKVPCLTPGFWTTFTDHRASILARTLAIARARKTPLPTLTELDYLGRLTWEEANIKACLHWGRDHLT